MLVVPENVQVGVPPFLKCGLAASAAEAVMAATMSTVRPMNIRRMVFLLMRMSGGRTRGR
jgi:hypothetical protein